MLSASEETKKTLQQQQLIFQGKWQQLQYEEIDNSINIFKRWSKRILSFFYSFFQHTWSHSNVRYLKVFFSFLLYLYLNYHRTEFHCADSLGTWWTSEKLYMKSVTYWTFYYDLSSFKFHCLRISHLIVWFLLNSTDNLVKPLVNFQFLASQVSVLLNESFTPPRSIHTEMDEKE